MFKKLSLFIGLLFITLITTSCSSAFQDFDRGIDENVDLSANDIPEEPDKEELTAKIKGNTSNEIDDIIAANFPLMDVVSGNSQKAEIYATKQFELTELSSVLTSAMEPDKTSEVKDNQQILIYPDHFVTLKVSVDDPEIVLIEVANDEFVRRNYSPNFLSTYFAYRLLDSVLGVPNWGRNRARECQSGNCYGGYSRNYSPNGTPSRGNTSFRGGGPGAGK